MGVKLLRKKKKDFLVSLIYRIQKFIPLSKKDRFKLFLKLEWIFDRLAHENSFYNFNLEDHPLRKSSLAFIMEGIDKDSTVLDMGCKYGDISVRIAERAKRVVGVDHDKSAILRAKRTHKMENLEFISTDAYEFVKSSEMKFDTLILSHILEHLDDPKEFLMALKGKFDKIYIELPDFDKSYLNHYRQELKMDLIYTDDDHMNEFDRDELKALLMQCGLVIHKMEYKFGIIRVWCNSK